MVTRVRTVLGDVPAGDLGVCDAHDHLFIRTPALPGLELNDPEEARERLRSFHELGGRTVVQWTPYGMGRRPGDLADLSRAAWDTHRGGDRTAPGGPLRARVARPDHAGP